MNLFHQKVFTFFIVISALPSFLLAQISPTSIVTGVKTGESRELKNIKPESTTNVRIGSREFGENDKANKRVKFNVDNANAISTDAALQSNSSRPSSPATPSALGITFDGNGQADNAALGFGGYTPPDPTMAIGPNHIVQMMNVAHSVFSKSGTRLSGPTKFSSIASFAGDDGDPIALYDQVADRFIILQFNLPTGNESLVFCVSKTSDPTGAYYVYNFPTPGVFPDYPHVGIWNDSYVITTHEFNQAGTAYLGQGYYAVDRKKMITGAATSTLIRFQVSTDGGYLPASFEGYKTPESTAPAIFCGWDSDETGAASDRLMIRTLNADFANPASSTLSAATIFATAAFDGRSPSSRSAIEQSGTSTGLDAIADRMMSRVIYRRFDNYESLVMNHAVNVSGVNPTSAATFQAAMRWYELTRPTPASAWTINQQSTFSPSGTGDGAAGDNRWMGSIGIDQKGNIAIGYSRSSSSTFPGIYYAERNTSDALSSLGAEQTFFAGSGSQTSSGNRWGDYSSMGIDPANEDSIWYTNEYYPATAATSFRTRIGKFKIDAAAAVPAVHFKKSGTIAVQAEAQTLVTGSACLRYKDYPVVIQVDQAPSQNINVGLITSGTATAGVDYDLIYSSPIVLNAGNLSATITLRVYDDAQNEPDESVILSYTLNVNGGNGVAALYNQKHHINIVGKSIVDLAEFTTATYGSAVTVYNENFDANVTGLGNWTEEIVTSVGTNINHFIVGTNFSTGFSGKALYISDDGSLIHYTATTPNSSPNKIILRAVSPAIDISGKGQVSVSFKYKAVGETATYDYGSLYYSTNGGTNWTNADAAQKLISQAAVITKTFNLPVNVENIANLKIAFQWENDYSVDNQPPLGVDDIVVTAKPVINAAQIQSAVNTGLVGTFNFGPNQTVYFIDTISHKIMASLKNNSAHNFGCTKIEIDRAGTSAANFSTNNMSEMIASKTFKITPANNNVNASYTIKLYYTEVEVAGWETATGQSRTGIKMVKVDGNNAVKDVTPANQGSFVYSINNTIPGTFGNDGITYETTFATSGFSGFAIGKPIFGPLPVTFLKFSGEYLKDRGNKLNWEVTNQLNVKEYEIQFSSDGANFVKAGSVDAKIFNSGNLSYDFLHLDYKQGNNFYRIRSIDLDGSYKLSSIVLINITEKNRSVIIYPNPVKDKIIVNYKGNSTHIQYALIDATGKIVQRKDISVQNPIQIPVANLASGNYILRITDDEGAINTQFVKEK